MNYKNEEISIKNNKLSKKQIILVILPLVLIISTYITFSSLGKILNLKLAYFISFMIYWIFWCCIIPLLILGVEEFKDIFKKVHNPFGKPSWCGILLLLLPPILALTAFVKRLPDSNFLIIIGSLAIAVVNATGEEILWRGAYIKNFSNSIFLGYLYPSLGFALWHISPQTIFPSNMPGGIYSYVVGALFLGLCWGWVSWKSKSIRWTIYSHILTDFLGLGAFIYFSNI